MSLAVRFHALGGPEALQLDDVDVPAPGPGEVLIQTRAWGLNRADVMFRTGNHFATPKFPQQQGLEAAGTIESVGAGVSGFAAGDPVSVIPAFALTEYPLHATLALAPARAVVKHPTHLTWEQAAAVWMAYTTAYGALIDIAGLQRHDVVAIPAASSSVGLAAIQIANLIGARPIALSRTPHKQDRLMRAGAAAVIATDTEDVTARLLDLTEGSGVNVILDPVAGPALGALMAGAARYATVLVYGALSGRPTELSVLSLLQKRLTVRGYDMVEVVGDDTRLTRAVKFIVDGLETRALTPTVDRIFPADQINDAYTYLEGNAQFGKVVVTAPSHSGPTCTH